MGYAVASQFTEAMKTKGELLKAALDEHGLKVTDFGRKLGYSNPYPAIQVYISGEKEIGERVGRKFAEALDLPSDYFSDTQGTEERRARNQASYEAFLMTELGRSTSADDLAAIRRVLPALRAPTVDWLSQFALHLRGQGPMPTLGRAEVSAMIETSPASRDTKKRK